MADEVLGDKLLDLFLTESVDVHRFARGEVDDFEITVKDVKLNNGAGFLIVYTGDIMTMPGLPKIPAANNMDIDKDGKITGLF